MDKSSISKNSVNKHHAEELAVGHNKNTKKEAKKINHLVEKSSHSDRNLRLKKKIPTIQPGKMTRGGIQKY